MFCMVAFSRVRVFALISHIRDITDSCCNIISAISLVKRGELLGKVGFLYTQIIYFLNLQMLMSNERAILILKSSVYRSSVFIFQVFRFGKHPLLRDTNGGLFSNDTLHFYLGRKDTTGFEYNVHFDRSCEVYNELFGAARIFWQSAFWIECFT